MSCSAAVNRLCSSPLLMERAASPGAGHFSWSGPLPLERATSHGAGRFSWSGPLLMERAASPGAGRFSWSGPFLLERESTKLQPQLYVSINLLILTLSKFSNICLIAKKMFKLIFCHIFLAPLCHLAAELFKCRLVCRWRRRQL